MSEYISDYLSHFVGRSKNTNDEKYELLKLIINLGVLTSCPEEPRRSTGFSILRENPIEDNGEIVANNNYVCFCDIPKDALDIHTRKYGKFGLSFSKQRMLNVGARPVHYIPLHGLMKQSSFEYSLDTREYYNKYTFDLHNLYIFLKLFCFADKDIKNLIVMSNINRFNGLFNRDFLVKLLDPQYSMEIDIDRFFSYNYNHLAFLKFYNDTLRSDDPNNFYYEREWRLLGHFDFCIDDISYVFLPSQYFRDFYASYRTFTGELIPL